MSPVKPRLGELELQQVQSIVVDDDQVFVEHEVASLEGTFLQGLARRATRLSLAGVLSGDGASGRLKDLRARFRAVEPVPFAADVATMTRVDQVLIEDMTVRELAGRPARYEYALSLRQYIEPPPPETETPPPPEPEPTPPVPTPETATVVVEVIVEGRPDFDFENVTVTLAGPGPAATPRTLDTRAGNQWTASPVDPRAYMATAVTSTPEPMSGSVALTARGGATTRAQIVLRPGAVVAKAFIVHFRFDNAFVEPCMRAVLRSAVEYASAHPAERMLLVGHTDKTGSDEYNQSLSERRARSVAAFLTFAGNSDSALAEWTLLRQPHQGSLPSMRDGWGTREYQWMLQDLDYYQGPIDGEAGPRTDAGVRAFQEDHALPATGVVDAATWTALMRAYMERDGFNVPASRFLPNRGATCDSGPLRWIGCGEQDPVRNTEDAWRPNRRVEILFVAAERLPCPVPPPVTFDLPAPGAVAPSWCVGPGDAARRCCLVTRAGVSSSAWPLQPALPGSFVIKGSVVDTAGAPVPAAAYVVIAPDGEFMDGERPQGPLRGLPVPGRTGDDGGFGYPAKPKSPGVVTFEIQGPFVARLASDPPGSAKGPVVCNSMDGSSALDIVIEAAETGDPRRRFRGIVHDYFGRPRPATQVDARFADGTTATAVTNAEGEFVIEMARPQETARLRYAASSDPTDIVVFDPYFVDVKSITTDEGVRRRLHNLGYVEPDLPRAVVAFQATHGLLTTGEADQPTRSKLAAVHDGGEPIVPDRPFEPGPLGPEQLTVDIPR